MSELEIEVARKPFTRWWGPYSPRRGRTGLTLSGRQISVAEPISDGTGTIEWILAANRSVERFIDVVRSEFGGGRLLFLPSGHIIKPSAEEDERCIRYLVGWFTGSLRFHSPQRVGIFDLAKPGALRAGDDWPGPKTIGLESVLETDGSLRCNWTHPDGGDRLAQEQWISDPDPALAADFRKARRGTGVGRVHVTANGHLYTNWQVGSMGKNYRSMRTMMKATTVRRSESDSKRENHACA
jgi:hypothetical protein